MAKHKYTFRQSVDVIEEVEIEADTEEEAQDLMLEGHGEWEEVKSQAGDWWLECSTDEEGAE